MTLIEAAERALEVAERMIDDEFSGTKSYEERMAYLVPVRESIEHAKKWAEMDAARQPEAS